MEKEMNREKYVRSVTAQRFDSQYANCTTGKMPHTLKASTTNKALHWNQSKKKYFVLCCRLPKR